jgi:RimJ/RimL family protein N-acetyltransferase
MPAWMRHDSCVDADALVPGQRFRVAGPGDATALLALKENLDRETSFMLLEPGERAADEQDVAADLDTVAGTVNSVVILAESAGQLVGYVDARGGRFHRNRITARVVIGVLAAASGQGAGSGLLRELERWARAHEIHRLELTVMAHNRRARQLYERMGFAVEGRRRECLLVDGHLVDELYMAKLLPARLTEPRR